MAATIPDAPISVVYLSSSFISITFGWSVPANNGGTPINDYKVYWNGGVDNAPFSILSYTTLGFITYTY